MAWVQVVVERFEITSEKKWRLAAASEVRWALAQRFLDLLWTTICCQTSEQETSMAQYHQVW